MKYMGSKRHLLAQGLNTVLERQVIKGGTFVDLFSGSGAVSWFAATKLHAKVIAVDLQHYSQVLSGAVIERTREYSEQNSLDEWFSESRNCLADNDIQDEGMDILDAGTVQKMRDEASTSSSVFVRSYAGYYLSTEQATVYGALREALPSSQELRTLCLAALIMSVSDCCASPGHTAQPLKPSEKALPFIRSVWMKDPYVVVRKNFKILNSLHSEHKGLSVRDDANHYIEKLHGNEVVFLDPPYSSVQYSRFYHVLEAVAVGGYLVVTGAGRMPPTSKRPQSKYSLTKTAHESLIDLLRQLAEKGCTTILTFPENKASNGITGSAIRDEASQWFDVVGAPSDSSFSTLGGGNDGSRAARMQTPELILTMIPKSRQL